MIFLLQIVTKLVDTKYRLSTIQIQKSAGVRYLVKLFTGWKNHRLTKFFLSQQQLRNVCKGTAGWLHHRSRWTLLLVYFFKEFCIQKKGTTNFSINKIQIKNLFHPLYVRNHRNFQLSTKNTQWVTLYSRMAGNIVKTSRKIVKL